MADAAPPKTATAPAPTAGTGNANNEAVPAVAPTEEVKEYRIHVSSKYLNLTKQKLELTRLPHEVAEPKSKDWWEPKPQVEPLIDYWLEEYSWRDQEATFNDTIPQFRTTMLIPNTETSVRIHFIHARSSRPNAVPLLLLPPFPATNLVLGHLTSLFTSPSDPTSQPFHLVIPSLPGLGFSDALPNNTPMISTTASLFNALMARLSYPHYLLTNSSSGAASAAQIDWKLANHLAVYFPDSCLATHFIAPPLASPRLQDAPLEWAKWSLASFFQAPILGYNDDDFDALDRMDADRSPLKKRVKTSLTPKQFGLNQNGLREPNTLAYALCDSPIGLLVFVLKSLRVLGPKHRLSPAEIINFTELAWLPGPEGAMRFWAHCATHEESGVEEESQQKKVAKPRVGITVFLGDEEGGEEETADDILPHPATNVYACPSWGNARYSVLWSTRAKGKPGLLAWERPEVISAGVRGMATKLLEVDERLRPDTESTVPLEGVVVEPTEQTIPRTERTSLTRRKDSPPEIELESPSTITQSKHLAPDQASPPPRPGPELLSVEDSGKQPASDETLAVEGGDAGDPSPLGMEEHGDVKGKEVERVEEPHTPLREEMEHEEFHTPLRETRHEEFDSGESPDTVVAVPTHR